MVTGILIVIALLIIAFYIYAMIKRRDLEMQIEALRAQEKETNLTSSEDEEEFENTLFEAERYSQSFRWGLAQERINQAQAILAHSSQEDYAGIEHD
ncbi:MAG: hypothetical protein LBI43_04580 [Streptococcaceae bacterium]|jgi:septation ring formation regulator EzrA|nr:hypothetical protein [Streptococcaceae bacterium]